MTEGDAEIKINPYDELMKSIRKRVGKVQDAFPSGPSIYKVPEHLRKLKEDAQSPRIVSIGPFHADKANLQEMEVRKARYVNSILHRTRDPEKALEKCATLVSNLEEEARSCYAEDLGDKKKRLPEILLVDACFILEVFFTNQDSSNDHGNPICGSNLMILAIQRDLLLLENQIPFFVLEELFENIVTLIAEPPRYSLTQFALQFFRSALEFNQTAEAKKKFNAGFMHLLDLVHSCGNPFIPFIREMEQHKHSRELMPCATKLKDAGIRFQTCESNNVFDMSLYVGGVLEIPQLYVNYTTTSLFRNFIAYEQCCHGSMPYITSYVAFMDSLIDSPQDVDLLREANIIVNGLSNSEDVCRLFNNISKEVVETDFCYWLLCEAVNKCYQGMGWWPRSKVILKRDYCPNPCRTISIIAAAWLLILTLLQTVYTLASFYLP